MRITAILIGLAMLGATPALAELPQREDIDVCLLHHQGDAIKACAALIATNKYAQAQLAEIYAERGAAYADNAQFALSLADFDAALAIMPSNPALVRGRGLAHASMGEMDEARKDFDRIIALRPADPIGYDLRARLSEDQKDYDAAMADANKALALRPDFTDAVILRGEVYLKRKQYDLALNEAEAAAALGRRAPGPIMFRAGVYSAMGQLDRAVQDEELALLLSPDNPAYLNNYCFTLARMNRMLPQALLHCKKALSIKPHSATVMDSLGFVYFRMGDMTQAAASYNAAIAANPHIASPLYMRGLIKLKQGDASGTADIAAAKTLDADIAGHYDEMGITAP